MKTFSFVLLAGLAAAAWAGTDLPLREKIPCAVADRQDFQDPDRVHLVATNRWTAGDV